MARSDSIPWIVKVVKEEFGVLPPDYRAARRLIDAGVSQQDVSDSCRAQGVPDPETTATINAMRNIELGLKPSRVMR